jgi:hypothetical protein
MISSRLLLVGYWTVSEEFVFTYGIHSQDDFEGPSKREPFEKTYCTTFGLLLENTSEVSHRINNERNPIKRLTWLKVGKVEDRRMHLGKVRSLQTECSPYATLEGRWCSPRRR